MKKPKDRTVEIAQLQTAIADRLRQIEESVAALQQFYARLGDIAQKEKL